MPTTSSRLVEVAGPYIRDDGDGRRHVSRRTSRVRPLGRVVWTGKDSGVGV